MDDQKNPKDSFKKPVCRKPSSAIKLKSAEFGDADKQSYPKAITIETTNPDIVQMKAALSGPLIDRARELAKALSAGTAKPFAEIIRANLGDGHAMGQIPITYIRQVLTLITYPKLLDYPQFPEDTKTRARTILDACQDSVGCYSDSSGIELIRRHVAEFIEKRDGGIPSSWQDIFLGSGASGCIRNVLNLFRCPIDGKKAGIMVPIPQFPLYGAYISEYGMKVIPYDLDESNNWALNVEELERARAAGEAESYPRVLVVINPGNPTGQVLSKSNIKEIIKFARKYNLFLLADEVYQDTIYGELLQFHSFKKILMEMGRPYSYLQMASLMSCSKGYVGECGLRGGYVEILNLDSEVKQVYIKVVSILLCPTVIGQACVDLVVCPPKEIDESYDLWLKEKTDILKSLKLRAQMVKSAFDSMQGFTCNEVQGALYAFPSITLPEKSIEKAKKEGKEPDVLYALELLESTGIYVVPGSEFGQKDGTYHFRTTILPQPDKLKYMLDTFSKFHAEYLKRYA